MDVLLNLYLTKVSPSNLTYLLRQLFNVADLINVVLNLSIISHVTYVKNEMLFKKLKKIINTCYQLLIKIKEKYI